MGLKRVWNAKHGDICEVHTDDRPRCSWAVRGFAGPTSKERFNARGELADTTVAGPVDTGVGPLRALLLCERHAKEAEQPAKGGSALHLVGRLGS